MANPVRWLDDLISSGASGVNSVWLKRAADAGVIKPGMSADEIHRAVASMASPAPARQLQLPLGGDAAGDSVRALIPYDNGARGFQMGANTTRTPALGMSPGNEMIPADLVGLGGPAQRRLGTTAGTPSGASRGVPGLAGPAARGLPSPSRAGLPAPAQRALPAPTAMRDQQAVDNIANQFDNVMGGRAPSAAPTPAPGGMPAWAKAAAGAGLIGAGATAWNMMPSGRPTTPPASGDVTDTGGTADLVEESRPAPKVEATPVSPRDQAQALIAKLNQMRRAAGGEVPEAPQMMAEINQLLSQSNTQRNAMTPQQAQGSTDPHIQAQAIIAKLNQMRQQAGGEVPQAQQMMAEVRRLQALGDQQRNYAQTR